MRHISAIWVILQEWFCGPSSFDNVKQYMNVSYTWDHEVHWNLYIYIYIWKWLCLTWPKPKLLNPWMSGVWPWHSGLTISTVDILVWPSRHKPNACWSMRISRCLLENHVFSAEGRMRTDGIVWKRREKTNCKLVFVPLMLMRCSLLWHRVSHIMWRSIPIYIIYIYIHAGLWWSVSPRTFAFGTDLKWCMAGCL